MRTSKTRRRLRRPSDWGLALGLALPTILLILALMAYWFGMANRAVVFLYHHDMGPRVPDTRAFSPVTRSRYWMTGFVAGGAVMALHVAVNGIAGRLSKRYTPPAWWRIWLLCAAPLTLGIVIITMSLNSPTLPFGLAALTAVVTLTGLALALWPGRLAARDPLALALLALDGMGLALWLTALPGFEYVPYWRSAGRSWWIVMTGAMLVAGVVALAIATGLRVLLMRTRRVRPRTMLAGANTTQLLLAGAAVAYLGLPLVHHLFATDGYFYITDMENFFSRAAWIQLLTWVLTAALAWATARLRERLGG
ncbi:MAG: hypothetical protein ACP5HG_05090 [Anaerolineae bacterium]